MPEPTGDIPRLVLGIARGEGHTLGIRHAIVGQAVSNIADTISERRLRSVEGLEPASTVSQSS